LQSWNTPSVLPFTGLSCLHLLSEQLTSHNLLQNCVKDIYSNPPNLVLHPLPPRSILIISSHLAKWQFPWICPKQNTTHIPLIMSSLINSYHNIPKIWNMKLFIMSLHIFLRSKYPPWQFILTAFNPYPANVEKMVSS